MIRLGTQLDTARFRSLIAETIKLPTQVTALILGEHGDSMVPIWSAAQAAGLPLDKFPGWSGTTADALFARTKASGAEVIKLKGGAGFAVGLSIADVVHSVAARPRANPAGSLALVNGTYGMRDVCISVPTVVGRGGVEARLRSTFGPRGLRGQHSATVLRDTIDQFSRPNPKAGQKLGGERPPPPAQAEQVAR